MTKQDDDKIKALETENELLRIQIAYLEQLEALAQEKKKITNQDKVVVITVLRQELKCQLKPILQVAEMSSSNYHDACKRAYKTYPRESINNISSIRHENPDYG